MIPMSEAHLRSILREWVAWTFAGFELQTGEPLRFKHHANVRSKSKGR